MSSNETTPNTQETDSQQESSQSLPEQSQGQPPNNQDTNSQVSELSQDECTNQYPLLPALVEPIIPIPDETHIGVTLEIAPVVDLYVNKPKIRVANYACGPPSRKCYRP